MQELLYLCSRENEETYGFMVTIGSLCANGIVVVSSHSRTGKDGRKQLQGMHSASLSWTHCGDDRHYACLRVLPVPDIFVCSCCGLCSGFI